MENRSSTQVPRIGSAGALTAQCTTTDRRPACDAMFHRAFAVRDRHEVGSQSPDAASHATSSSTPCRSGRTPEAIEVHAGAASRG
jgi:hypothetical protein